MFSYMPNQNLDFNVHEIFVLVRCANCLDSEYKIKCKINRHIQK
jgi:hypothetical protein